MKALTCWEHLKTSAREARKPRSIQQKSVRRKRNNEVSQHSAEVGRKGGAWPHKKSTRRRMRGDARATVQEKRRESRRQKSSFQQETVVNTRFTRSARSRFHSRVQLAGRDSRDVCSAAQMSAEVKLHSEGCRERIGRTDVKNGCVSRKKPEQEATESPTGQEKRSGTR